MRPSISNHAHPLVVLSFGRKMQTHHLSEAASDRGRLSPSQSLVHDEPQRPVDPRPGELSFGAGVDAGSWQGNGQVGVMGSSETRLDSSHARQGAVGDMEHQPTSGSQDHPAWLDQHLQQRSAGGPRASQARSHATPPGRTHTAIIWTGPFLDCVPSSCTGVRQQGMMNVPPCASQESDSQPPVLDEVGCNEPNLCSSKCHHD